MSILNGLANLLIPDYLTMFLIRTPAMNQAERELNGFFREAIDAELAGNLDELKRSIARYWIAGLYISFILNLIPLTVIGGLSGFQQNGSIQLQRGFTMA